MAPAFCLLAAEGFMAVLRLRHRTRHGRSRSPAMLAILPLGGVIHDVIWPYVGFDNVVHRRLASQFASTAAPVNELIVFNGVTPPPLIPDLMITRWLQTWPWYSTTSEVSRPHRSDGSPIPTPFIPAPAGGLAHGPAPRR